MPAAKSAQTLTTKAPLKTTRKPSTRTGPKVTMAKPGASPKRIKEAKQLKSGKTEKTAKAKKEKVIRDSFTMPKQEFEKIAELKKQCLKLGVNIKKSEILRAGLHALGKFTPQQLKIAVSKVEKIKTGRP